MTHCTSELPIAFEEAPVLTLTIQRTSLFSSGRGIDVLSAITVLFTISLEVYTHFKYRQIWKDVAYDGPSPGFSTALVLRLLGFTVIQLFYLLQVLMSIPIS